MHNNIMAAGSKDRPPMLGPGRYSQWRSRFLRYLDTKSNGEYLRKCIFEGPYLPTNVLIAAVEAAENILQLYFQAEKEAIFLLLTGIGDENLLKWLTACNTSKEMWTAIERLQQEWSRFVTVVKQRQEIDTVSYHKLFDVLKQFQNEVNDIRSERLPKVEIQLALLAAALPYSDKLLSGTKTSKIRMPHTLHAIFFHTGPMIQNKRGGIRVMKKNLAILAILQEVYNLTNQQPSNCSNSRNKDRRYPHQGITTVNQLVAVWDSKEMTVVGLGKPKRVKGLHGEEIDEQEFGSTLQYMANRIQDGSHLKNPVLLVCHWNW
ncbi:hypothetical protein Tco_0747390 [Tanacetum coccineum]|uniref:Uncharacterized protein n=1 Tax=Tanacetum coccineum TaxID=301880 RepID=A0ABQ4YSP3_9ASTR